MLEILKSLVSLLTYKIGTFQITCIANQLVNPPDNAKSPAINISVEKIGENIPYIVKLNAKIFVKMLLFIDIICSIKKSHFLRLAEELFLLFILFTKIKLLYFHFNHCMATMNDED